MEEIKAMIAQLSGRPPEAGLVQIRVDFEQVNWLFQLQKNL
jgi:hypothetical protein